MKIKGRLIEKRKASAKAGGQDGVTGENMIKTDYIHTDGHTDISIIVIESTVTYVIKMLMKQIWRLNVKYLSSNRVDIQ